VFFRSAGAERYSVKLSRPLVHPVKPASVALNHLAPIDWRQRAGVLCTTIQQRLKGACDASAVFSIIAQQAPP
jgi:hypothetical protein